MRNFDLAGVSLSAACIVHCLAVPVLVATLPALAWAENEYIHLGLAILAGIASFFASRSWPASVEGYLMRLIAILGLAGLVAAALVPMGELSERALTVFSAGLLASAHLSAWFVPGAHRH